MAMASGNCWNLRVTAEVNQGGRKYMEDVTSVQFERVKSGKAIVEYAAFAIFDGHGGKDAAYFARDHLLHNIKQHKGFFSSNTEVIKKAISDAFLTTHLAMWNKLPDWPKTSLGHPSTAGTTASLVVIRGNRMFVANVGDSMIVMGIRDISDKSNQGESSYSAKDLTIDHKPELLKERQRIEKCGGCVMNKSGVNRVVWARPKLNHSGPIRRSTKLDKIPFLAVARSLGDLWSFNSELNEFVVSPIPDVYVYDLHKNKEQFIVLASDGLWNMIRPQEAVDLVGTLKVHKPAFQDSYSPANVLVQVALDRWKMRMMRADNTSVIVVIIERRKLNTAKSSDTYIESWTSAEVEGDSPNAGAGEVPTKPAAPTGATFTTAETPALIRESRAAQPLQDSSVSSSSISDLANAAFLAIGEARTIGEASKDTSQVAKCFNNPSTTSLRLSSEPHVLTRSQPTKPSKTPKRKRPVSAGASPGVKTRRMSLAKRSSRSDVGISSRTSSMTLRKLKKST